MFLLHVTANVEFTSSEDKNAFQPAFRRGHTNPWEGTKVGTENSVIKEKEKRPKDKVGLNLRRRNRKRKGEGEVTGLRKILPCQTERIMGKNQKGKW